MNDSYFTKIKLPEIQEEKKPVEPTEPEWPNREEFAPVMDKIITEINKVQQGTSQFSKYAITFTTGLGKGAPPIITSFRRFRADPTKKNMLSFLEIVENDINLRCKREFVQWLTPIIKGKN